MDGSHYSSNPVLHRHIVSLDWYRTELDTAYRFLSDWDVELDVPYDVKDEKVRYELPDGTPYDSPTGPLHHRTETLEGFGDLRLLFNYRPVNVFLEGDQLHAGFGSTIPTGRTEENPYELAALGIPHQHIQFGTGTFDPLLRFDYSIQRGFWGFDVALGLQAPLYENRKGYKGSTIFDAAIGPRFQFADWLCVAIHYTPVYQTRAFWDGEPDENSGYFLQGLTVRASVHLSSGLRVMLMAMRTLDVDVRAGGDSFEMDWMLGISLDVAIGGSAP